MRFIKIILLIVVLFTFANSNYARAKYSDYVQVGGKSVKTSSITTYLLMETFPSSTVTVYLAGTTNLATIYSNNSGSAKANPFTADSKAYYEFYADNGFYDVKYSGTGIASPFTRSYIALVDPNEDFNPKSFGAKCDNSTTDNAAFEAIKTLVGSANSTITIPRLGPCRLNTISFPANLTLNYGFSGGLYANNSNIITILSDQIGPNKTKRYYNGLSGQGTFSFAGNRSLDVLYPEWWGAKADSTITDNSPPVIATIAASKTVTLPITVNAGVTIKFGIGEYLFNSNVPYVATNNSSIVIRGEGYSTAFLAGNDNITILSLDQGNSSNQGLTVENIYFNLNGKDSAAIDLIQGGQQATFRNIWVLNPSATGTKKLFQIGGEFITLDHVMVAGTISAGVFPANILNTNIGIYITHKAPFRLWLTHIIAYSLGTGIAADNNFEDGATCSLERSSIHGNLVGTDIGNIGGSPGVAQFNWTIKGNQFESNVTHLSISGISSNFPLHSFNIVENYFTGIDATMIGIKASNIDALFLIRNIFKNATASDHTGIAVKFTGTIARATKQGNISITIPTNISPDMNINGNSTASLSGGSVFQFPDLTVNEDSIDVIHAPLLLITNVLTYGVTVATNCLLGDVHTLVVTDGVAFTISNPTNFINGKVITYDILNSSGGAMGTITWGAAFKLTGSFTNPANTKRRRITFQYDGTNWVEDRRSAGDI